MSDVMEGNFGPLMTSMISRIKMIWKKAISESVDERYGTIDNNNLLQSIELLDDEDSCNK